MTQFWRFLFRRIYYYVISFMLIILATWKVLILFHSILHLLYKQIWSCSSFHRFHCALELSDTQHHFWLQGIIKKITTVHCFKGHFMQVTVTKLNNIAKNKIRCMLIYLFYYCFTAQVLKEIFLLSTNFIEHLSLRTGCRSRNSIQTHD